MAKTEIRIGGLGGQGEWRPGTTGRSPGGESPEMVEYLLGRYVRRASR